MSNQDLEKVEVKTEEKKDKNEESFVDKLKK